MFKAGRYEVCWPAEIVSLFASVQRVCYGNTVYFTEEIVPMQIVVFRRLHG